MSTLLQEWENESKKTKVNPIKRIEAVEEKVDQAWSSYQELTIRLDRLTSMLNLSKGKIAVFAAASIALGKSYFGARNENNHNMLL